MPQSMWVCPFVKSDSHLEYCPCCNVFRPTAENLLTHCSNSCNNESIEGRSFSRQDHLMQHMRLCHPNRTEDTAGWRRQLGKSSRRDLSPIPLDSTALVCGFCGHRPTWWGDRVEHIGNHFQTGADLTEWWLSRANNCHGYDYEIPEAKLKSIEKLPSTPIRISNYANQLSPAGSHRNEVNFERSL
jgi:hypothetical protein